MLDLALKHGLSSPESVHSVQALRIGLSSPQNLQENAADSKTPKTTMGMSNSANRITFNQPKIPLATFAEMRALNSKTMMREHDQFFNQGDVTIDITAEAQPNIRFQNTHH